MCSMANCFSCLAKLWWENQISIELVSDRWYLTWQGSLSENSSNTNSVTATNKPEFSCNPLINSHDNTLLCSYAINQHLQVTNPCERTNDHSKQWESPSSLVITNEDSGYITSRAFNNLLISAHCIINPLPQVADPGIDAIIPSSSTPTSPRDNTL